MKLRWTDEALADLDRLFDFLSPKSAIAAGRAVARLRERALQLREYPRLGERRTVPGREVRSLIIAEYELRYEIAGDTVSIARIFHARENR